MTLKRETRPHGPGSKMPHYRAEVMTLSFDWVLTVETEMPITDSDAKGGACQ